MATNLGLDPSVINAHFDPTTRELTYHVRWNYTFARSMQALGFNFDLGQLAGINTTANLNLDASAATEFTFGISLAPSRVPSVATQVGFTLPANGRITADAHFSLTLDTNAPVTVTVLASATAGDNSLADLVNVLNSSLATAGLGSSIVARLAGNRITLTTANATVARALKINVAANDPAATQLGFEDGKFARVGSAIRCSSIHSSTPTT